MSASNKKKLRKEQESVKLTEKQLTAQKEAKKLKLYTAIFAVVLVVLLVVAVSVGISKTVSSSGIRQKSTVALTVGDHEINSVEMNYFFMDAVNAFYSQYGSYATMFGLDTTKPLDQQVTNEETGATWADDFLETAKSTAAAVYTLKDAADAAGYCLTEEEIASVESQSDALDMYAKIYGYPNGDSYLRAMYGAGANKESYIAYSKLRSLADSYRNSYTESLTYTDSDLREAEKDNYDAYSSFTYHTYYLPSSSFLTGGTTDAEGNTAYTDEEKAAALSAAKEAADSLAKAESLEALEEAIDALSINEGQDASTTAYTNTLYSGVSAVYADWVTDSSRKEGDMKVFENEVTSTDEDGNQKTTVNGYYVVCYVGSTDNNFALKNVRHILVSFTHDHDDTEEHDHSEAEYTDEEKAAAKAAAEELLAQWKSGEATEESFATLANENSDDGDGTTGGLYENVYPGQMVTNFNDWVYDSSRKVGDTGIVESNYGYHVMYFVGDSDTTYRDYQITNELRQRDVDAWYSEITGSVTPVEGDMKYLRKDLVLNSAG